MEAAMKNYHRMKKLVYCSVLILLIITSTGFSQDFNENEVITQKERANYLAGIESENPGLKSSSIYFAGRYRLNEAGEMLVDELKKCQEEDLSLLIAWSIYKIGEQNCLEELNKIAANQSSKRLKKFCEHLKQQKKFEFTFERSRES
jgi:hypothetical protein